MLCPGLWLITQDDKKQPKDKVFGQDLPKGDVMSGDLPLGLPEIWVRLWALENSSRKRFRLIVLFQITSVS